MYKKSDESPFDYAEDLANYYGLLILDDLGAEKITDFVKQITYYIINEREINCLQTIITSNFNLSQIDEMIDSRVSSRISAYNILNFGKIDRRIQKEAK